jgi:hypothetical protein
MTGMKVKKPLVCVFMLALVPALARSVPLEGDDPTGLLKRVITNLDANELKAENYTFVEDYHNINYDKNGKIKVDETAKFETVFVEGTPYRRKVEENGKPLSGKAAKEEEKKYQAAVAERRRMNAELKNTLFHREFRFKVGYGDWPDLFVATSGGDEIVDGHEVIKLILTPRSGIHPTSDAQTDSLHTAIQLWIDKADEFPLHLRIEYTSDGHLLQGSTVEAFWQKEAKSGTYLLASHLFQFKIKYLWMTVPGKTEQKYSGYKRFGAEVRIIPEPIQPK